MRHSGIVCHGSNRDNPSPRGEGGLIRYPGGCQTAEGRDQGDEGETRPASATATATQTAETGSALLPVSGQDRASEHSIRTVKAAVKRRVTGKVSCELQKRRGIKDS
jgi:hypothetical protein